MARRLEQVRLDRSAMALRRRPRATLGRCLQMLSGPPPVPSRFKTGLRQGSPRE